MYLAAAAERERMLEFVRARVPAAANVDGDLLTTIIDRFPGVLERWVSDTHRERMVSIEHLTQVAADAQQFRYRELSALLPALPPDQRRLAMKISILPQLDQAAWRAYGNILVSGLEPGNVDELSIGGFWKRPIRRRRTVTTRAMKPPARGSPNGASSGVPSNARPRG